MRCLYFQSRFFLCLFAASLAFPSCVNAKEPLAWSVFDFPPFQILEGAYKGSGSFDGELQTLIAKMPEFEHKIVPMSFARRREEFIAGTNLCTPGIFRAPAMALNLAISMPALTHLDNRVIFLKEKAPLFGKDNPIDLDALFSRGNLLGAVVSGRSYAPNIDAAIQRFSSNPKLMIRPLGTAQLFQMLLNGDIDYLLLFSHEAAFLADKFGVSERIVNRPIAGTPPYIFTHVACTGNAWGHAVIGKINAVLQTERSQPDYRKYSERWYPLEDQDKIRRNYPNMLKVLQ
ncbi:MAG: TIGR02285 family protein [Formivibrio sp.]|nr:TIGR02285 family protein [Formivibrio sp.]